ncbi:MAG: substrate-binding domain-containing protein [Pirellulales bacterium]|nr:substrate-binding domain-containing protein [Pirellulales bacterium]
MSTVFKRQTNCELLAQRLGQDILLRGLKPGDRYISAVEAAAKLGVSRMSADRAMNVLVEKRLLVRQRGRGTFVGPNAHTPAATNAIHIHIMSFAEGELAPTVTPPATILAGLRRVMPSSIMHTHLLPFADACLYARQLVESEPPGNRSGWILGLSPREVQQWFSRQSVPAIVLGDVFPGISLPTIHADQTEVGGQLIRLAHTMGARRFAFINRQNWRQGDVAALNGALQELSNLGMTPNRIEICNVPGSSTAAGRILHELIQRLATAADDEKQALLCRSTDIAKIAIETAEKLGLKIPDDLQIVYNRPWTDDSPVIAPCVDETATAEEGYAMAAAMLERLLEGNHKVTNTDRLSVQCVFPKDHEVYN